MISIQDRIREDYKIYSNKKFVKQVFICKGCPNEIFVDKHFISKHTGFCYSCTMKNRKPKEIQIVGLKICKDCKKELDISKFSSKKRIINSTHSCMRCSNLKKCYGITSIEYDILLVNQNNVCGICELPESEKDKFGNIINLSVDHCHKTGVIRGLLCAKCNKALGLLNDDINLLKSAILYLKKCKME